MTAPIIVAAAEPLPDFQTLPDLIGAHARAQPQSTALVGGDQRMSYAQLDAEMDRVAATLAARRPEAARCDRDLRPCEQRLRRAVHGRAARRHRGGAAGTEQHAGADRRHDGRRRRTASVSRRRQRAGGAGRAHRHRGAAHPPRRIGRRHAAVVMAGPGAARAGTTVAIDPAWPFNIIYSSGTTGTPKGIVQPHSMRWGQVRRAEAGGYGSDAVTLIATPLYSNTTLVVVIPTLARGGAVVLLPQVRLRVVPRARRATPRHAHDAGAGAVPASDGVARLSTATTCRAFASRPAPARRFAPSSRPRCCAAGRAGSPSTTA